MFDVSVIVKLRCKHVISTIAIAWGPFTASKSESEKHQRKECIPVGCVPPALCHTGETPPWIETPWKEHGPETGMPPQKEHGPDRKWHHTETSSYQKNDWQTGVKTLPFRRLRLRTVKNFDFVIAWCEQIFSMNKVFLRNSVFDELTRVCWSLMVNTSASWTRKFWTRGQFR